MFYTVCQYIYIIVNIYIIFTYITSMEFVYTLTTNKVEIMPLIWIDNACIDDSETNKIFFKTQIVSAGFGHEYTRIIIQKQ